MVGRGAAVFVSTAREGADLRVIAVSLLTGDESAGVLLADLTGTEREFDRAEFAAIPRLFRSTSPSASTGRMENTKNTGIRA